MGLGRNWACRTSYPDPSGAYDSDMCSLYVARPAVALGVGLQLLRGSINNLNHFFFAKLKSIMFPPP